MGWLAICFSVLQAQTPALPAPAVQEQPLSPVPGEHSLPSDPLLASKYELRDAARDAPWATEAANELMGAQLSALAELIRLHATSAQPIPPGELAPIANASHVVNWGMRPDNLVCVFESPVGSVWRHAQAHEYPSAGGLDGLSEAIAQMTRPFRGGSDVHVKFKVVEVIPMLVDPPATMHFSVRALLMIDGRTMDSELQQNSSWALHWEDDEAPGQLRLNAVDLERFEEIRGRPGRGPIYQDQTQSALGATEAWRRQLTKGLDQWAGELDASLGGAIVGHEGIALGDVDGDGLDDLYVCQSGGLPNRLFRHAPDGTLDDVSAEYGVDFLDHTRSALILDFDNDGDQDLTVAMEPWIVLLENRGPPKDAKTARFEIVAKVPGPSVTSLAAADVDQDGDLDLYACGYTLPDRSETTPVPYHDANNGRPNILYRNDGKFAFVDVTREIGLDQNNRRFSFAASFEDFDDDGDQDLYVANDFGRNNLYRNDGGEFSDVAAEAGALDIAASMGVSWGDYDGDGRMDLYVSNMFSSAGERVTFQRNFRPEFDAETRALFQRHARGNSLFRNQGDGTFRDVSIESGTTMGRWAWGAKFVDFDNDGSPDIFVPNGFVTGEDPADL